MTETNQNSFVLVVEISKFLLFVFSCISQNFERRFEKIESTLEIVHQEKDDHRLSARGNLRYWQMNFVSTKWYNCNHSTELVEDMKNLIGKIKIHSDIFATYPSLKNSEGC